MCLFEGEDTVDESLNVTIYDDMSILKIASAWQPYAIVPRGIICR
jgi:hypothetical protein